MARNKKNWDYLVDYYGNYRSVLGTGQKGDPGPAGTGTQGVQGPTGPAGIKGPQGNKGDVGPLNSNAFEFNFWPGFYIFRRRHDQTFIINGIYLNKFFHIFEIESSYTFSGNFFVIFNIIENLCREQYASGNSQVFDP